MTGTSSELLIAGYVRYEEELSRGGQPDTPDVDAARVAYEEVEDLVRRGPSEVAWELVLGVLAAAPDERLDVYAAGLLENAVVAQGVELVDRIEEKAAADARFRWALGHIWLSEEDLPPDVLERIVKASGGAILVFTAAEMQAERAILDAIEEPPAESGAPQSNPSE